MSRVLEGKAAVVTGAGRGIGRGIALELARQGASVVVNDLGGAVDGSGSDKTPAEQVVAEIAALGGKAVAIGDSVADYDAAERIVKTCVENYGQIDILVNVAGIERAAMVFKMTPEIWKPVLDVHLNGTFNLTRHASVLMREQRSGKIISFTSDAWRGTVGHCNYAAAKGGIVSLMRSVAMEMGKYGVTANSIAPIAGTRMTMDEKLMDAWRKRYAAGLATKEQLEGVLNPPPPDHIAPFIAYLACDAASHINGQVFHVEAGHIGIYSQPVEVKRVYRDYKKVGAWTVEELEHLVPEALLGEYVNPAPPEAKG